MSPVAVFLFSLFILPLQNYECSDVKLLDDDPLNPEEKKALLDFIKHVGHSPRVIWNEAQHACTSWKGVYCYPDNNFTTVTHLRLPATSLVGEIPPNTIGKLTSLRVLSLRINGLSGELPFDFANLTSLTRLYLNNNQFSGSIPSYFSNFTKLIRLSLDNNNFSGQLPNIKAKSLEMFNISVNRLNSSIPRSLSHFPLSDFTQNVYLCGSPTNITCNGSYPSLDPLQDGKEENKTPLIVGISIGSAVLLLILLCCVRKIYQQPKRLALQAAEGEGNNLKMIDHPGFNSFDLEDLLKASAEVLGVGSAGTSYKQMLERINTTVVVKRLKDMVVTENEFRKTMEVLGSIKDKTVVPLIAYYYSRDERLIVYEYMPAVSLSAHLHGNIGSTPRQLHWDHRMRIALSAANGLAYLHEHAKVVHGNIKSLNILIRQETIDEASLSDYGLNALLGQSRSQDHHVTSYWAPEVHHIREVTFESDVYSFGVVLLELLTGKNPAQASLVESLKKIKGKTPMHEFFDVKIRRDHNIEEMMQLLLIATDCVLDQPSKRPKMCEVVNKMDNLSQSLDDPKGYYFTPSTDTRDTPSTITP